MGEISFPSHTLYAKPEDFLYAHPTALTHDSPEVWRGGNYNHASSPPPAILISGNPNSRTCSTFQAVKEKKEGRNGKKGGGDDCVRSTGHCGDPNPCRVKTLGGDSDRVGT